MCDGFCCWVIQNDWVYYVWWHRQLAWCSFFLNSGNVVEHHICCHHITCLLWVHPLALQASKNRALMTPNITSILTLELL